MYSQLSADIHSTDIMVIDGQLDRVWKHLEDKPLAIPVRDYLTSGHA